MFTLVDQEKKEILTLEDLGRISELMKYNLSDEDIQEVVNNVAGFGKREITWEQFDKYIVKKMDKKHAAQWVSRST